MALPYKLPNDDDDVQYVLASQLALPGGGTQSVKKRLTKKERDMYVNAYKEAVRQTRGWSLR